MDDFGFQVTHNLILTVNTIPSTKYFSRKLPRLGTLGPFSPEARIKDGSWGAMCTLPHVVPPLALQSAHSQPNGPALLCPWATDWEASRARSGSALVFLDPAFGCCVSTNSS